MRCYPLLFTSKLRHSPFPLFWASELCGNNQRYLIVQVTLVQAVARMLIYDLCRERALSSVQPQDSILTLLSGTRSFGFQSWERSSTSQTGQQGFAGYNLFHGFERSADLVAPGPQTSADFNGGFSKYVEIFLRGFLANPLTLLSSGNSLIVPHSRYAHKDCCSRSIQHAVLLSLNACLRWHLAGRLGVFTTAGLKDARGLALLQSRELRGLKESYFMYSVDVLEQDARLAIALSADSE